jgi:hypothetical protein
MRGLTTGSFRTNLEAIPLQGGEHVLSRHHPASARSTDCSCVWWLMDSARFNLAFQTWPQPFHLAFPPGGVWPIVGTIFVPWTTLAYLIVFPGGLVGLDWVWLGLGLLIDLGSHFGGGYRHRDRIRGHRE